MVQPNVPGAHQTLVAFARQLFVLLALDFVHRFAHQFNLHELAPDTLIRQRFALLFDLAFVEEEQICVNGHRGGSISWLTKTGYGIATPFESYKNLLFASEGKPSGCGNSRVIETSGYQLPTEAIYLRNLAFPAREPLIIRNRVLGELETVNANQGELGQRLAADSALVNYAYRTPHYLLGSTLQNPALTLRVPHGDLTYQFGTTANHLEVTLYDAKAIDRSTLPLINGKALDLRPAKTYQSPFFNADFGSEKISVSVGPRHRVLDFSK